MICIHDVNGILPNFICERKITLPIQWSRNSYTIVVASDQGNILSYTGGRDVLFRKHGTFRLRRGEHVVIACCTHKPDSREFEMKKYALYRRNSARPKPTDVFMWQLSCAREAALPLYRTVYGHIDETCSGTYLLPYGCGLWACTNQTRNTIIRSSPRHCPFPVITFASLNRDQTQYNSFENHLA